MVVSNYGLSAHHEFQAKQNLGPDLSSTLPVLSFDSGFSGSTNDMDLGADGVPRFNNDAMPHYAGFPTQYPGEVSSVLFSGIASQPESRDYENLGVNVPRYTSKSPSYMSQTPGVEEPGYVDGEAWDFDDMNIPNDLYNTMTNIEHADQNISKR
jgi:hypothetical protein